MVIYIIIDARGRPSMDNYARWGTIYIIKPVKGYHLYNYAVNTLGYHLLV